MQTNTKQEGSSSTLNYTGADNRQNSNSKIDIGNIEKIEDTVFSIVNGPEGWFLSIGKSRVTECYKTRDEAIDRLEVDKWNILMKMIIIVVDVAMNEEVINKTHYYNKNEDRIMKNQR